MKLVVHGEAAAAMAMTDDDLKSQCLAPTEVSNVALLSMQLQNVGDREAIGSRTCKSPHSNVIYFNCTFLDAESTLRAVLRHSLTFNDRQIQ